MPSEKEKIGKKYFLGKLWPGQVYLANDIQEGKQLTIFILSCQHFLISNINISSATMVPWFTTHSKYNYIIGITWDTFK